MTFNLKINNLGSIVVCAGRQSGLQLLQECLGRQWRFLQMPRFSRVSSDVDSLLCYFGLERGNYAIILVKSTECIVCSSALSPIKAKVTFDTSKTSGKRPVCHNFLLLQVTSMINDTWMALLMYVDTGRCLKTCVSSRRLVSKELRYLLASTSTGTLPFLLVVSLSSYLVFKYL